LSRDPANPQAVVYLADARMRMGFPEEAAQLYRQALDRSPTSDRLQLSLALASIKAGRYGDARNALETAAKRQPDSPEITNALARLLATAPQASLRDGTRALEMAKALFATSKHPEIGQTYAMALAETGHFDQATALQREVIIVAGRNPDERRKAFLERNLGLYERHRPTREGWSADDPVFQPRNPVVRPVKVP